MDTSLIPQIESPNHPGKTLYDQWLQNSPKEEKNGTTQNVPRWENKFTCRFILSLKSKRIAVHSVKVNWAFKCV